jgi:hypothetical protein
VVRLCVFPIRIGGPALVLIQIRSLDGQAG